MFILSKLAWLILAPSNLLILATLLGLALWRIGWLAGFGKMLATIAGALLLAATILPVGDWMLRALEQRFPPYVECGGQTPAGIILLGGGQVSRTVAGRVEEDLNDGADRMRYAAKLARRYPFAPVVIAGGQVYQREGARSEADGMADILIEQGVDPTRLRLEASSRTTAENAANSAVFTSEPGRWVLVTSAYHMPRSIGSFRKAGVDVIAAPTDWRVDDKAVSLQFSASDRLGRLDMAAREYLGLAGYWVMGRSSGMFPEPRDEDACPAE
jgi:uncharacterized SAM-binding protein YcdF (DUF218 family)